MARFKVKGNDGCLYTVPDMKRFAHCSKNEALIVFDAPAEKKDILMVWGIGRVTHVEKGETMDIVCINFGRTYSRRILVIYNHARRQIYNLKRGQLATFFGEMKLYKEDGKTKVVFLAKGFNAWFVPKMLDIKKYDSDTIEELTEENETDLLNFLDEVLKDSEEEM